MSSLSRRALPAGDSDHAHRPDQPAPHSLLHRGSRARSAQILLSALPLSAPHCGARSARAWSQKTIGGCWERQSEEDENIDPGARCHCVDAPAAQTHSSGGFTEAVSRSESASCRFDRSATRLCAVCPHRLAMLPNVICEPQTSRGVYSPNSPKNSSMRYFNVSYHKNLLRLGAYCSPTPRLHALQVERILGMPRQQVIRGGGRLESKVRDPAQGRVPRKLHTATYPLVTTGGGALPLPTPVPQPATLRRASTAAVAKAIFFMGSPP